MVCNKDTKAFVGSFSVRKSKTKRAPRKPNAARAHRHPTNSSATNGTTSNGPVTSGVVTNGTASNGRSANIHATNLHGSITSTPLTPGTLPINSHASETTATGSVAHGSLADVATAIGATPVDISTNTTNMNRIKRKSGSLPDAEEDPTTPKKQRMDPLPSTGNAASNPVVATAPMTNTTVRFVMETPNLGQTQVRKRKRPTKGAETSVGPSLIARRHSAGELGTKRKLEDEPERSNKAARRASEPSIPVVTPGANGNEPSEAPTASAAKNDAPEEAKKPVIGFRINRPVKADVNIDIWRTVFKHSVPRVLLNARMVCRAFKAELHDKSPIWNWARKNAYGEETVPCPGDMNEREFCNLIEGFGCQSHGCRKFPSHEG